LAGNSNPHGFLTREFFRRAGWWLAVLGASLPKLLLVSGHEILTQEADASSYALAAVNLVWGSGMDNLVTHPSAFPFVAGLIAQLGVPWRIALEVLYLCSCYGLASVVGSVSQSRVVALWVFALLIWHPWPLSGFDSFMSEPFILVVTVALLACLIRLLSLPPSTWRWSGFVASGLLLFLWEWSRYEDPLVYASYGFFVFLVLGCIWSTKTWDRKSALRTTVMLILPVVLVFVLSVAIKSVNQARFGVRAKAVIGSPGLMALMTALYKIKPNEELRFAPVTRQSLEAACQVSPTLHPFASALLNPKTSATLVGETFTRVPGEFGPWLNWLLFGEMPYVFTNANRIMQEAAGEIEEALEQGRLPRRSATFPLDPNWQLWLPALLPSIGERLVQGFSWVPEPPPWGISQRASLVNLFDRAANRRRALVLRRQLLVEGTLRGYTDAVDSVGIMDEKGVLLGGAPLLMRDHAASRQFGLSLPMEQRPSLLQLGFFHAGRLAQSFVLNASDESSLGSMSSISSGTPVIPERMEVNRSLSFPGGEESLACHMEVKWEESAREMRVQKWEKSLVLFYPYLLMMVCMIVAGTTFAGSVWQRSRWLIITACGVLILGWIGGRAALYGLVDANVGWTVRRYMSCISPLGAGVVVIVAGLWGAGLRCGWERMRRKQGCAV
jgi:hypothetical protein